MDVITYSAFRQHLKTFLDSVFEKSEPLFIKRSRGEDIVVMSKSDYESMQETFYLLSNPVNAKRLLQAKENIDQNSFEKSFKIEDLEDFINGKI